MTPQRVTKPRSSDFLSGDLNLPSERERKINSGNYFLGRKIKKVCQCKHVTEIVWFNVCETVHCRPS